MPRAHLDTYGKAVIAKVHKSNKSGAAADLCLISLLASDCRKRVTTRSGREMPLWSREGGNLWNLLDLVWEMINVIEAFRR